MSIKHFFKVRFQSDPHIFWPFDPDPYVKHLSMYNTSDSFSNLPICVKHNQNIYLKPF